LRGSFPRYPQLGCSQRPQALEVAAPRGPLLISLGPVVLFARPDVSRIGWRRGVVTIAEQAAALHAEGKDDDLLAFAAENWPAELSSVTADQAEVARFARIAAYRQGYTSMVHVWQARSVAAGAVSGNLRSLALSIQTHVYALLEEGQPTDARQVLDVVEQLASASAIGGSPSADLLERIVADRRALSFRVEERWSEALTWYQQAKALTPVGSRDRAKVTGAEALARWLAGGSHADAAKAFAALVEESSAWDGVHKAARANHAAAVRGDSASAVPFDLM
jgi:hypothetical protein